MDRLSKSQRSELMSRIRCRGTGPEEAMASILRRLGFSFRTNPKGLPGNPDFVVRDGSGGLAVFVHGCFWHGCRRHFRLPKSRTEHWREHIRKNRVRHVRNARRLRSLGYRIAVVWEHDLARKKSGPRLGAA